MPNKLYRKILNFYRLLCRWNLMYSGTKFSKHFPFIFLWCPFIKLVKNLTHGKHWSKWPFVDNLEISLLLFPSEKALLIVQGTLKACLALENLISYPVERISTVPIKFWGSTAADINIIHTKKLEREELCWHVNLSESTVMLARRKECMHVLFIYLYHRQIKDRELGKYGSCVPVLSQKFYFCYKNPGFHMWWKQ